MYNYIFQLLFPLADHRRHISSLQLLPQNEVQSLRTSGGVLLSAWSGGFYSTHIYGNKFFVIEMTQKCLHHSRILTNKLTLRLLALFP